LNTVRSGAGALLGAPAQRGLLRATEAALVGGNAARLLVDGPAAYPAMLELIRSARERIAFENYIIRDDATGRRFAQALVERARAGVEVRVLYDWLGSRSTARGFWRELRAGGVRIGAFGAPTLRRPYAAGRRNHRKLVLADGRRAVVGGLCIGDEWMPRPHEECWRDTAVLLEGPVVHDLEISFARMWQRTTGQAPPLPPRTAEPAGDVRARVIDAPPKATRTYRLYQFVAALAARSLYITGAYTLAPAPLRAALAAAASAGVDVRLLAPGRSDVPIVNQAARAHYASLLRAGVRIYEWQGPMLHAKTMVADEALALVGSTNLNAFSFMACYELDVEIQDPGIGRTLHAQFLRDLENAREITISEWRRRPVRQRLAERLGAAALWLPYRIFT